MSLSKFSFMLNQVLVRFSLSEVGRASVNDPTELVERKQREIVDRFQYARGGSRESWGRWKRETFVMPILFWNLTLRSPIFLSYRVACLRDRLCFVLLVSLPFCVLESNELESYCWPRLLSPPIASLYFVSFPNPKHFLDPLVAATFNQGELRLESLHFFHLSSVLPQPLFTVFLSLTFLRSSTPAHFNGIT